MKHNDKQPGPPITEAVEGAIKTMQDEAPAAPTEIKTNNLKGLDPNNLYRMETFTDLVMGDIRVVVPVVLDGRGASHVETDRPPRFFSSMVVAINNQPNTVNFEIPAATLAEAIEKMPATAEAAGRTFLKQVQAQRAHRPIIVPGATGLAS